MKKCVNGPKMVTVAANIYMSIQQPDQGPQTMILTVGTYLSHHIAQYHS